MDEEPRMRGREGHKTDIGEGGQNLMVVDGNAERTKEKSKRGEAQMAKGKETRISPLAKSSSHFIDGQKERKMRGQCRRRHSFSVAIAVV